MIVTVDSRRGPRQRANGGNCPNRQPQPTVTTTAEALTTYECVNGGGNNPQASNKTTTQSKVSTSGTFKADQNGNIVNSETLTPPSASSLGFSCPAGQTVTFVGVTYSNVEVNDTTSGASITLPGSYPYTNPLAP